MQKKEIDEETDRSKLSSRRSTVMLRRDSSQKDNSSSASSTPKKIQKGANFDFCVTGKQILKKSDRAHSLPATHRRQSSDALLKKRVFDSPRKLTSQVSRSRNASVDDELSLDLSQISDIEETNSKHGKKFVTSTPKSSQRHPGCVQTDTHNAWLESRLSKDSSSLSTSACKSSSASPYRHGVSTDVDISSVSPSSVLSSDSAGHGGETLMTPHSQDFQDSLDVSTWQECSEQVARAGGGEWGQLWGNYDTSVTRAPVSRYYDQCPTPYRTEDIDLPDFDLSTDGSRKRSPEDFININNIIRNEGLHLTPRETQNIIKCAHILGNVLTKAIDRQSKEKEFREKITELKTGNTDEKKKNMSLNLKETVLPLEVREEKRCESVPTQTDISLPNTKSAPKIFENILRQLSKSSIDENRLEAPGAVPPDEPV